MAANHESVMYDVHDFKVYSLLSDSGASPTYGAAVDVPGIAEVSLEPNLVTAELKGDARVIAKKGRTDRFNVSATYGKLSLDALDVILQGTVADPSSDEATWELTGDNDLPYFKVEFKVEDLSNDLGDLHVILYKCQLTGGTLLAQSSDEFGQPSLELEAIPAEADDSLIKIRFLNSVTALSS